MSSFIASGGHFNDWDRFTPQQNARLIALSQQAVAKSYLSLNEQTASLYVAEAAKVYLVNRFANIGMSGAKDAAFAHFKRLAADDVNIKVLALDAVSAVIIQLETQLAYFKI